MALVSASNGVEFPAASRVSGLNQDPQSYFGEVEQAALTPDNVLPGIGLSPPCMLQGRVFAYCDAQRCRIGTNHQLRVSVPSSACQSYQRDGAARSM